MGGKKKNVFRIDTTSSWISSQQCSVLPNKKHMWVKKMLPRLRRLDSVSLTWLSFSTPRPTRFIHLSWLNHTKDRVGAVRRALIWHLPLYPAGRFLWVFFFFAPAWFSQFTPLWLLVQRVWRLHIIPSYGPFSRGLVCEESLKSLLKPEWRDANSLNAENIDRDENELEWMTCFKSIFTFALDYSLLTRQITILLNAAFDYFKKGNRTGALMAFD